jgi:hypothetical protein
MTKTIDLGQAARSQDAERFTGAVRNGGGAQMGAERFTASGDSKAPAPVRATISGADFSATGMKRSDHPNHV